MAEHILKLPLPLYRWVCQACGKFTEVNGARDDLHDSSCVHWAIKCRADKRDGKWVALEVL